MTKDKALITLFLSLSGGQGKTLSTYTTGIKLSKLGYPCLLIDADPQHNLTDWLGLEIANDAPTLLEVLKGEVRIEDAIYPVPNRDRLFIVPCDRALSQVSFFLSSHPNPSIVLKRKLESILSDFAMVGIDAPPQNGHVTLTSIGASDVVIIPAEATSKGIGSVADSKNLLLECAESNAFAGNLLGVIPFRAKLAGIYLTKDTKRSIDDMIELVGEEQVFSPIYESEVFKNCLNSGLIPSELAPLKAGLEKPFNELIERLRPYLLETVEEVVNG
jgi:chromosome partitioning protein